MRVQKRNDRNIRIKFVYAARVGLMSIITGALGGCGYLTAHVRGLTPLNQNEHGESTPVDVRFYQLRRSDHFRAATVEQLWLADGPTLATDLIGERVVATVYPGTVEQQPFDVALGHRAGDTEFIGVLLMCRHGDARDARVAIVRADDLDNRLLELSGCSIAVRDPEGGAVGSSRGAQPAGGHRSIADPSGANASSGKGASR